MPDLNAILAPKPLQLAEVASIIAPQMVIFGLAQRAFTHAYVWDAESPVQHAAESVLTAIADDARASVNDWLGDMQTDGEPRFFQKDGLKKVVDLLCQAAGAECCAIDNAADVATWGQQVDDRASRSYDAILERASA